VRVRLRRLAAYGCDCGCSPPAAAAVRRLRPRLFAAYGCGSLGRLRLLEHAQSYRTAALTAPGWVTALSRDTFGVAPRRSRPAATQSAGAAVEAAGAAPQSAGARRTSAATAQRS